MVLLLFALFRAGFEPLSWRSDHGPSLRIEGRSVFLGGVHKPRRGSKPARNGVAKEPNLGRAEFFALPFPGFCAVSPTRHTSPLDRLPNARYIAEARERFTLPRSG